MSFSEIHKHQVQTTLEGRLSTLTAVYASREAETGAATARFIRELEHVAAHSYFAKDPGAFRACLLRHLPGCLATIHTVKFAAQVLVSGDPDLPGRAFIPVFRFLHQMSEHKEIDPETGKPSLTRLYELAVALPVPFQRAVEDVIAQATPVEVASSFQGWRQQHVKGISALMRERLERRWKALSLDGAAEGDPILMQPWELSRLVEDLVFCSMMDMAALDRDYERDAMRALSELGVSAKTEALLESLWEPAHRLWGILRAPKYAAKPLRTRLLAELHLHHLLDAAARGDAQAIQRVWFRVSLWPSPSDAWTVTTWILRDWQCFGRVGALLPSAFLARFTHCPGYIQHILNNEDDDGGTVEDLENPSLARILDQLLCGQSLPEKAVDAVRKFASAIGNMRGLPPDADVKDVLTLAWEDIRVSWAQWDPTQGASDKNWFAKGLVFWINRARREWNRHHRLQFGDPGEEGHAVPPLSLPEALDGNFAIDTRELLFKAVSALSPDEQFHFHLRIVLGLPPHKVAPLLYPEAWDEAEELPPDLRADEKRKLRQRERTRWRRLKEKLLSRIPELVTLPPFRCEDGPSPRREVPGCPKLSLIAR